MPTIQTSCCAQILLCLCIATSASAQSAPADSSQSIATARATIFYQSYVGPDAAIYNGIVYQANYRDTQGDQWFQSGNLTTGTLIYENLTYTHIPLLYDLVHDQLVISDPKGQLLVPPPGKVRQFTFADHLFVYLSVNNSPGYYEQLSSGYASLFVRHTKKWEERIEGAELHHYITSHDEYFIYKQDHFYSVGSDKRLLTLLSDKKKQLQQFQNAQHLRFKKDPATAMQAIVDHYNQLSH
ncbi:hypothetical protein [Puia sp.]|jgi:hypothetical protein|uniref:hypothetical protein n=1 Tax=Puia sp. TaxID=2045100 RepID=UPI002F3ED37C